VAKPIIPTTLRKPIGVFLVVLGLILHLIPLFPAGWIIVLGLELIGVRILFRDKFKSWLKSKKNKDDINQQI